MRKRCKQHNAFQSCQTIGPPLILLPSPNDPPPTSFSSTSVSQTRIGALERTISGSEQTLSFCVHVCAQAWMCVRHTTIINCMRTVSHSVNLKIEQRPTWVCVVAQDHTQVYKCVTVIERWFWVKAKMRHYHLHHLQLLKKREVQKMKEGKSFPMDRLH